MREKILVVVLIIFPGLSYSSASSFAAAQPPLRTTEQLEGQSVADSGEQFDPEDVRLSSVEAPAAEGLGQTDKSTGKAAEEKPLQPQSAAEGRKRDVIRSIKFVGNHEYKEKTLEKKLGFKVGDYLDLVLAEAYRGTLSEFYHNEGFAFAEIKLDTEKLKESQVVYVISEGPKVKIAKISFHGNKSLKSSDLQTAIKTGKRRWFILQSLYVAEKVAEDVQRLQNVYYDRGYLDYKIEHKVDFNPDKSRAYITFEIMEGPVYTIRNIIFSGAEHFDQMSLRSGMKLEPGQPYNKRLADLHAKGLTKLYREQGFINAEVEQHPAFIADVNMVNVVFGVTEGRQFRIGLIDITGNEQTQDKVVRRILDEHDFTPGKLYNADMAPKAGGGKLETELRRMVLAEEVTIRPVEPAVKAPDQKDARVDIKEGKTGMVMLGGGVSSDAEFIGQLVYNQQNFDITDTPKSFEDFVTGKAFKGAGQSLRIAAEPGTRVSQYNIEFTEPYFRDKPVSLNVVGSSWKRYQECYDEGRDKGFFGFEKRYKNQWRRSIGFRMENVKVSSISDDAPKEIQDVRGDNLLAGVRVGIGRDLRDDRWLPSAGTWFDAGYEQVGGDSMFGILTGTYRWYKTLYQDLADRKTVLATKILGGTTLGSAQPFEKFYAGGTGTYGIRGFEYRGVSTRGLQTGVADPDRRYPIGSNWIFIANTEVTTPLYSETFAALFFVDSGVIDSGGYRASAGTGIQILIPQWFGPVPMRFELAAPLLKREGDKTRAFSFSVGRLF